MTAQLATKGEFAGLIKVSPGRVSQYFKEGKLGPDHLEGEGRHAKIKVQPALQALKVRLDAGQMTGNGLSTRLEAPTLTPPKEPEPASEKPAPDAPPQRTRADDLEISIKTAKLEQQQAINRKLDEEEKARAGIYVMAEDAKAEAAKLAVIMLQVIETGISDMAGDIAAQFNVPERDVEHLLAKKFRVMRADIAARLIKEMDVLPPLLDRA